MTLYQEHGARNRREYLRNLADEFDAPVGTVFALAEILGPEEDFDALVVAMEDHEWE